jgi:hypothetical protein
MSEPDNPAMGARVWCVVCGARPFPPPGMREDLDLMKLTDKGAPAGEGDADGRWYCSRHYRRTGGSPRYRIVADDAGTRS